MISANGVTLRVGKKALFEDVNIKFTEGNCYGLIGANGAGKSTFLKILSGALETTSGDVTITPGQRLSVLEQDHFKYDAYPVMDVVIMGNERLYQIMKEKDAISESLRAYVAKYPSQTKAAGSLKGVSVGTVSNILNGRYENISDEMFRNVASQVGGVSATGWQIVETGAYQEITAVLSDAQRWRNVTWVTGEAGCGKSTTARVYLQEHREVFYILCSEDMKKGDFVREIARTVGIRTEGYNIREVWGLILDDIIQMDAPLLVFDEADKLTEPVFHYFISLYNKLEEKCGVVFLSTDYIAKRISNGLRYQKPGYKEFYSRIGRKFYELEPTDVNDVFAICSANGVTDKKDIDKVIKEASTCDFDLRRVRKSIHKVKRMVGE